MKDFLSNGGLSKMLWIILTFILSLGALIILFWEIANNQALNPLIVGIVSGTLGHAFTIGGHIQAAGEESH